MRPFAGLKFTDLKVVKAVVSWWGWEGYVTYRKQIQNTLTNIRYVSKKIAKKQDTNNHRVCVNTLGRAKILKGVEKKKIRMIKKIRISKNNQVLESMRLMRGQMELMTNQI